MSGTLTDLTSESKFIESGVLERLHTSVLPHAKRIMRPLLELTHLVNSILCSVRFHFASNRNPPVAARPYVLITSDCHAFFLHMILSHDSKILRWRDLHHGSLEDSAEHNFYQTAPDSRQTVRVRGGRVWRGLIKVVFCRIFKGSVVEVTLS